MPPQGLSWYCGLSLGGGTGAMHQSHIQVTRKLAALSGEVTFPIQVLLSPEGSTAHRDGLQPKEKVGTEPCLLLLHGLSHLSPSCLACTSSNRSEFGGTPHLPFFPHVHFKDGESDGGKGQAKQAREAPSFWDLESKDPNVKAGPASIL